MKSSLLGFLNSLFLFGRLSLSFPFLPYPSSQRSLSARFSEASAAFECKICREKFESRNSLFRHVRSIHAATGDQSATKKSLAITFSYGLLNKQNVKKDQQQAFTTEAQIAGDAVRRTFFMAWSNDINILSSSQVSLASQRQSILSQGPHCAAVGDVLVIHFSTPKAMIEMDTNQLKNRMHNILENDESLPLMIQVQRCQWISASPTRRRPFHAETDCLQRTYHYLLPVKWLPDGKNLESQLRSSHFTRVEQNATTEAMEPLRKLKQSLKTATCPTLPNRRMRRKDIRNGNHKEKGNSTAIISSLSNPAVGRSSVFSNKQRRAWHNFADPSLHGTASPNVDCVWRILDTAKTAGFHYGNVDDDVNVILEFRGDDFLPQQIRRLVGSAVAMVHGWLPQDFTEKALRTDHLLETVLAPSGRLYLSHSRLLKFNENLDQDAYGPIRNDLLHKLTSIQAKQAESNWLYELEHVVTPRIRKKLNCPLMAPSNTSVVLSTAPPFYTKILTMLREIVESERWPNTSVARSAVILNGESSYKGGSFTVVNPKTFSPNATRPLANVLFPDLAECIFELEHELSRSEQIPTANVNGTLNVSSTSSFTRHSSTHCAVNCRAQFTVHVDSGKGAGQSLSMIVGLGDYKGGGLGVEQSRYDIRYRPLQFDGWRSRHWTFPYAGERFSLVWFTPAGLK
mmetsp:Transcript_15493/g.29310  ORF Transcript_15493/g.29310 Transcript_15493/m.29310 type:complete len:684 (+) Transcript_15493:55-2106(+)